MVTEAKIKAYWERCTPFRERDWDYESKRKFRYDLQDYMHKFFRFEEWAGKEVLEVGCGVGMDSAEFARNGASVCAVDLTEDAIALTKMTAHQAGVNVDVLRGSGTNLPFARDSFDAVYSYGVLHHIPNVNKALAEICRVLRPNGTVLAMVYHRDSLLYAYSIIYRHLDLLKTMSAQKILSRYSERNEGCPYTKAYTKQEAYELFNLGFKDVVVEVHYNVIDTDTQRKVKLSLDDEWELGWHLCIRGEKKR